MTKKTFLFACLLGMLVPGVRAHHNTSELVSVQTAEKGKKLPLKAKELIPGIESEPDRRTLIPEVILQGYTLHFITPCNGCTFRLVQSDNTYYEVEITGNTLIIPATFTGMYELQIVSGDIIFYTDVEL